MKDKTKKILIPIAITLGVAAVFFIGFFTRELTYSKTQRALLNIIDKYEKYYYYESDDVIDIISDAIFDKYSYYMTKEEYQAVKKEAGGDQQGIGLSFYSGSLKIVGVVTNSPCDKAGVEAGGVIEKIEVNGQDKPFTDYNSFIDVLDGVSIGGSVKLTINYDGEVKSYSVVKSEYKRSYVTYRDSSGTYNFIDSGGMNLTLDSAISIQTPNTAYIKYEKFSGKSSGNNGSIGQLKTALSKFADGGNKNLILDIRNNGGGAMEILSEVAGLFVEKQGNNQVVAISKDKYDKEKLFYVKNNVSSVYGIEKLIVLANQNTASASEAFIGALLDYDLQNKVTVVLDGYEENGEVKYKTFGKGIMQTTYTNLDGSAVKVTTAKLYWPKTQTIIHSVGITEATSPKVKNAVNGDAYEYAINMLNN